MDKIGHKATSKGLYLTGAAPSFLFPAKVLLAHGLTKHVLEIATDRRLVKPVVHNGESQQIAV